MTASHRVRLAIYGVSPLGPWEARTAASEGAAGCFKDAIARHLPAAGELQAMKQVSMPHVGLQEKFASP